MASLSGRHAKVVFSGKGFDDITLDGQVGISSGSITLKAQEKKNSNDDDDDSVTSSLGFIVGMAVGGAVLLVVGIVIVWCVYFLAGDVSHAHITRECYHAAV